MTTLTVENSSGIQVTIALEGVQGPRGEAGDGTGTGGDGASAYELAVANGFEGTVQEWLASLQGTPGADGADGDPGADGASAYELAVANGFEGTVQEWLASLQGTPGADGDPGADGASAYELAVANGFEGTVQEWLASLQGAAFPDAPSDGNFYARRNGQWVQIDLTQSPGGTDEAPTNLTTPVVSGSTVLGSTLTVDDGTWDGSPAPTLTRQWHADGVDIDGQTAPTLITDDSHALAVIGCRVTATNSEGSASAESNTLTMEDVEVVDPPPTGDTAVFAAPNATMVIEEDGRAAHFLAGSDQETACGICLMDRPITGKAYFEIVLDWGTQYAMGGVLWADPGALPEARHPGVNWLSIAASIQRTSGFNINLYAFAGNPAGTTTINVNIGSTDPASNPVARVAVDGVTRQVWIAINGGAWHGGGDPAAGTTPTLTFPGTAPIYGGANSTDPANVARLTDPANFAYAVPAGFTAGVE